MRRIIKQFVKTCVAPMDLPEPIYEFGSLQVPGQEGFADLRPFFPGKKYVGTDMRAGLGVDILLDLHNLGLEPASIGSAIVLETLEHVEYPRRSIAELYRVLKPGGVLVISSLMKFPIHNYPSDYWRYTPEGFKSLLQEFGTSFVGAMGETDFPHTVVGIGTKEQLDAQTITTIESRLAQWKEEWEKPRRSGFRHALKPFVPPIVVSTYLKSRKGKTSNAEEHS